MIRKPIQLVAFDRSHDDGTYTTALLVLCNDGTIWQLRRPRSGDYWEHIEGPPDDDEE